MVLNSDEVYECLIAELNKKNVKYEIHKSISGSIMIDVWHKSNFYVFQIDSKFIGVSIVNNEESGFNIEPDKKFLTLTQLQAELSGILI